MLPTPWMRDGLALQRLGALGERRLLGDAGGVGDVLAQHHLDQRPVDQIGDGEEPLALRGRAQEHRARAHGEIGAAGDHGVDRGHADEVAVVTFRPSFLKKPASSAMKARDERQRRGRQRHHDLDFLPALLPSGGTEPKRDAEAQHAATCAAPFEHRDPPNYRSV